MLQRRRKIRRTGARKPHLRHVAPVVLVRQLANHRWMHKRFMRKRFK
jgi:hypothetical protein